MVRLRSRTALSGAALAIVLPSGLNATLTRKLVWPVRVAVGWWVAAFHRRTVLSWLAVARVLPSGLNTTVATPMVCPVRVEMA